MSKRPLPTLKVEFDAIGRPTIWNGDEPIVSFSGNTAERKRYARLFAAAPDLLAFAQAEEALDADLKSRGSMPAAEYEGRRKAAVVLRRAALAKVGGK